MANNTRKRVGKTSPELARLEADLARIDRERKTLERQIISKAAEAEHAQSAAKSKRRKPKAKKRAWKCGVPIPQDVSKFPEGVFKFPLTPHASGKWMKKIRGAIHYFGCWAKRVNGKLVRVPDDGWELALALYNAQKKDLEAGRTPRVDCSGGLTLKDLSNRFLTAKQRKVDAGELSPRTLAEYVQTAELLCREFGTNRLVDDLAPEDFQQLRSVIAKRCGPVRRGNEITRVKSIFRYAVDNGHIEQPVRFGSDFKKPDKATMRKHRNSRGKKLFTAAELRLIVKRLTPDPQLRAAVLLGVNAGLGNTDIANMRLEHLDLEGGWLNYPRGKTGIPRRVPLWPETVKALRQVIAARPAPKDDADQDVVFLTPRRNGDVRGGGTRMVILGSASRTDYIGREFGRLLHDLKINGRKGLGFYSLRHTFATVGLQVKDRDAVKAIMGHVEGDVLAAYDETGPSDERRLAVTEHVRYWLFGEGGAK